MRKYSEYKKVDLRWIEEVPSHWDVRRIGNIFEQRKEKNNPIKTKEILSLSAKYGVTLYSERKEKGGNKPKDDLSNYNVCHKGDILLNSMNVVAGAAGISQYCGAISPVYYALKIIEDGNSVRYMEYFLRNYDFQRSLIGLGKGIQMSETEDGRLFTVRMRIAWDALKTQNLLLPSREEQDQIANYLDWKINEIDRLIEKEKILFVFFEKFFESKCESLIKHVILDSKLKFKLRHLARFQNGISESGDFFTDGFPFVSYSDVYNNTTLPSEVKGKAKSTEVQQRMYSVNKGDIFVTRTSETIDDAIFFSLCEKTIPNSVFSGFLIRIRPTKSFVLSKYLLYYLKTTFVRTQILKNLNLVTRVSVGQSLLKDIEIKIPDKEVQEYVIQIIDEMSNKIEEVKKRINEKVLCLQKLKQSLISEVVTGKIDVRDIEIPEYEKVNLINEEPDDIENEEE